VTQVVVRTPEDHRYQLLLDREALAAGEYRDATAEPTLALRILALVAPQEQAREARLLGVEQSNTSIVYDGRLVLKIFRRLQGANPEVEVITALHATGFAHVVEPLAVWRGGGDDLAVLQPFLAGARDGWDLAVEAARRSAPFEDAARLGLVTAAMHQAFAVAFGSEAADARQWAAAMAARIADVQHPELDHRAVGERLGRVADIADAGRSIRIHGDYHLGQTMRADDEWYVLDFEGEPRRPVAERRAPSSPLRDVAGMLRSFAYAAAVGEHPGWDERAGAEFRDAYVDTAGPLLPQDPAATNEIIDAWMLDKAVYELGYEQAHRPDWVGIPLAAVRRYANS
jgi:maltokinase